MSRVCVVDYKGKNIIEIDLSESDPQEALQNIHEAMTLIKTKAKNSVLLLTNVKNTNQTKDLVSAIKDFAVSNVPYVKASAVVGIDETKRPILATVRFLTLHEIRQWETVDEARDWLVQF